MAKLNYLETYTRRKRYGKRVWLDVYRTKAGKDSGNQTENVISYFVESSAENVHRLTEENRRLGQTVDGLLQSIVEKSWREANKGQAVSVNTAR